MSEESKELAIPDFKGNDLLPVDFLNEATSEEDELVGRENLDVRDFAIPTLALLQPQSPAVAEGTEGAKPGRFMVTASEQIVEGPIRAIAIMHNKSRKMDENAAERAGAQPCRSFDAVEGNVYGACDQCEYAKWGKTRNDKPPCSLSNDITLLLQGIGPVKARFRRTGFPSGKSFVQSFLMSRKNLWHHPVVLSSTGPHDGPQNSKYFKPKIVWDTGTVLPRELRDKARKLYDEISAAFEQGRLVEDDSEE